MPEDDKPLNLSSSVPSNQKDVLSNKDIIDKKVLLKNYIYIYIYSDGKDTLEMY